MGPIYRNLESRQNAQRGDPKNTQTHVLSTWSALLLPLVVFFWYAARYTTSDLLSPKPTSMLLTHD